MPRQIIHFQKHAITGRKSGICPKCGKGASRSKEFWQTESPFNANDQKKQKSLREILTENSQELKAWKKEPVFHAKCED